MRQHAVFTPEKRPHASAWRFYCVARAGLIDTELRTAVILAGKETRKLNFGKREMPVRP